MLQALAASKAIDRSWWRHRILKLNPLHVDVLYGYRERETPDRFKPIHGTKAFWIDYDSDSSTPQLWLLDDDTNSFGSAEPINFSDTKSHFETYPTNEICGWRFTDNDMPSKVWELYKKPIENHGQRELNKYEPLADPRGYVSGPDPTWVLRRFFIGPHQNRSPPYITVLCSEESKSKLLVDSIAKELSCKGWDDWGVTRLPQVEIRAYGSRSGSPENMDEAEPSSEQDRIEVRITNRDLLSTIPDGAIVSSWINRRHRCGVGFQITNGSTVITSGTIGGLIKVGERFYGLTVAHVFPPSSTNWRSDSISSSPVENTIDAQHRWREPIKMSMSLDWALVEIPELEKRGDDPDSWDDVNLVPTMNGDFRPVMTAGKMPYSGIYTVLATPGSTHCLRGILTGEEAIVRMPGSRAPYTTWVLQMEQPWLIQSGDSGSWAFDAITGDLLGVLVAGCPELQEAYIIPAYQMLDHIRKELGKDVRLPNGYRIQTGDQDNLEDLERDCQMLLRQIKNVGRTADMKNAESRTDEWIKHSPQILDKEPEMVFQPRSKEAYWVSHYGSGTYSQMKSNGYKYYMQAPGDRYVKRVYQDALSLSPLERYNSISSMCRNSSIPISDETSHPLGSLWGYLVLGEQKLGTPFSRISTPEHSTLRIFVGEVLAMEGCYYHNYAALNLPRDRCHFKEVIDMMRQRLEDSVFEQRRWYSISLPETSSFVPDSSGNITLFIAVLLNEHRDRVFVLASPAAYTKEGWKIPNLILPYVQMDKGVDGEENLRTLLEDLIGLRDAAPYQPRKIELRDTSPSIWLEEQKQYVDLIAYEATLCRKDFERVQAGCLGMRIVNLGVHDAHRDMVRRPFAFIFEDSSAFRHR